MTGCLRSLGGAGLLLICGLAAAARAPVDSVAAESVPARRIVSLAPHLTEMAFAAGAGDRLVGVAEFSDYPPGAASLPRIGDAFRVDYERLARLDPDLILAWRSGNPPPLLARLSELGFAVETFEPTRLDDVASQILRIGELAGTTQIAADAAADYRSKLAAVRARYRKSNGIRVFYQVAAEPLFTVSDRHVIGQVIQLCGGQNVFGGLLELTPVVAVESVLDAAPQVILVGTVAGDPQPDFARWRQWPNLPAVRNANLYAVPADLLSRPGPRLVAGAARVCEALEKARTVSPAASATVVR